MKNYFTLLIFTFWVFSSLLAKDQVFEKTDSTQAKQNYSTKKYIPPVLEIGIGTLSYFGELNTTSSLNAPLIGRFGYHMAFKQPITSYLEFNINAWGGQLSANERTLTRNLNFESTILSTGVSVIYNFSNFLKPDHFIEPILGLGIEVISFESKTDLISANDETYYYWNDGSIRDMEESSPNSGKATQIHRDYNYETEISTSPMYDLDKYNHFALSIPLTIGAKLDIGDKWDFRTAMTYHFTTTDLIDGVSGKTGAFEGDKKSDNILYTSVSISYNFQKKEKVEDAYEEIENDSINIDMNEDEDGDGVIDWEDDCLQTPAGAEVDEKGCPLDTDNDGVPNYADQELNTAPNTQVDSVGVTLKEEDITSYYERQYDTTGTLSPITKEVYSKQTVANKTERNQVDHKEKYAVGIVEFENEIPSDMVNNILSLQDVNTVELDGKILVTVGSYNSKEEAEKRQEELDKKGVSTTEIIKVGENKEVSKISGEEPKSSIENWDTNEEKDEIIYRVQIGAFTKKADERVFKDLPSFIQVKSDDGYVRYFTGSFKSYSDAAKSKINILSAGFTGAFVVAFKNGNRIALNNINNVNLNKKQKSSITSSTSLTNEQKQNMRFKIQLGSYKNQIPTEELEKYMVLGDVEQMEDKKDHIRYVAGSFKTYEEAANYKVQLLEQGFDGCFVVGVYYGKIITSQQAKKMLSK